MIDHREVARLVSRSVFDSNNPPELESWQHISTPGSDVYRLSFHVHDSKSTVFAKIARHDKEPKQKARAIARVRREYEIARSVENKFEHSERLGIVRPAAYIEEIDAFVTWEVTGHTLQDVISEKFRFKFGSRLDELLSQVRLTGVWLKQFHSLNLLPDGTQSILSDDIQGYYFGRLDALAKIPNSGISKSFADQLCALISRLLDEVAQRKIPTILCHNDFSPHNIIVQRERITVLDYSYSSAGLAAFDTACFWHKIEDLKSSFLQPKSGLNKVQRAFLDGYGLNFDLNQPDIKLGLLRLILSKMLTLITVPQYRLDQKLESKIRYRNFVSQLESEVS